MTERVSVTESVEIPPALDGERVDRVVAMVTGLPRTEAAALIDAGGVTIGGRPVASRSRKVSAGQILGVDLPVKDRRPAADADVELTVVHADAAAIVVDKPAGLVVHPGAGHDRGTMVNGLLARFPDLADHAWPAPDRPGVVHRLDKGTSGLLMVGRTPSALVALSAQLQARTVERSYLALVWGRVESAAGVVDAPVGRSAADATRMAVRADGRPAITRFEVVGRYEQPRPATLLRCALETGRTHQIRVHLTAIGHALVGDDRYRRAAPAAPGVTPGRPFLHAAVLGFDHPEDGRRLRFESGLPADLQELLGRFS